MHTLLKTLTITLSLIAGLPALESEINNPGKCAQEITLIFLTEVVADNYVKLDFTNFIESVRPLREVCNDWNCIIDKRFMHDAMLLGCHQICPGFHNATLIYRPNEGSDEGMIVFKISDLWNPLEGTFKLSQCGTAGRHLSISTGYPKRKKTENAHKVEIWFTPRFLVEKELGTTAGHLKAIFPSKWQESAPVGILWTWGGNSNLDSYDYLKYDYLTTENMDNLSKINLYENWEKSRGHTMDLVIKSYASGTDFQILFVN